MRGGLQAWLTFTPGNINKTTLNYVKVHTYDPDSSAEPRTAAVAPGAIAFNEMHEESKTEISHSDYFRS